jgi:AraC-like DNA-binding protein
MAREVFRALSCAVAGVHAVEADTARGFPRHSHDQFGIGLIRRGAQRSMSGRGMVEAGPGMVITVNPGEVHDGLPLDAAGRSWSMLYFDPAVLEDLAALPGRRSGPFEFHRPVMDDRELSRRFQRLYQAMVGMEETLPAEERALLLLDWLAPRRDGGREPDAGNLTAAFALIEDDPAASLSLSKLASACGLDRFQFLRGFLRRTGVTPHAHILQRRVAVARRLIAAGMPLSEAALVSGFCDQSHLTRHFSRILGITPGAYAATIS